MTAIISEGVEKVCSMRFHHERFKKKKSSSSIPVTQCDYYVSLYSFSKSNSQNRLLNGVGSSSL